VLAMLHSPQQTRELGFGFKGADGTLHGLLNWLLN